jgi:hypothetical protein
MQATKRPGRDTILVLPGPELLYHWDISPNHEAENQEV